MKILFILLVFVSTSFAEEQPVTIYYTTNGSAAITVDPMQTILDANPYCPEWLRKYDKYSRFEYGINGLEWRLHRWTCILTGQTGWTPEPIGTIH